MSRLSPLVAAVMARTLLRSLVVAPVATAAVAAVATPALASPVSRIAGADRVDTSVEVARHGWSQAEDVLVATAVDYPDAVAAAALAARLGAPLLLTAPDTLPATVRDALEDLGTSTVTILGGTRAVSARVERELVAMGIVPQRIAGPDRYDTAAQLASEASGDDGVPVVAVALGARADGRDAWPDALAAASLAGLEVPVPTLLTEGGRLPGPSREAIEELDAERVIVLGGEAAISRKVVEEIRDLGVAVTRAHGDSRYSTAVEVAETAMEGPHSGVGTLEADSAVVVSGRDFPDALAAGALAARRSGPLLLTPPGRLADAVDGLIRSGSTDVRTATIVGGERAVSGFVAEEITAAIAGEPRPTPEPECPPNSSPDCSYTYRHPIETWERLARCESGGNWSINTGNGYYGGLQFSLNSWRGVGGRDYPHRNTKWEQIHRGERLQQRQGWGAWPSCSRKLGLR